MVQSKKKPQKPYLRVVEDYMEAWLNDSFADMVKLTQLTWRSKEKDPETMLRMLYRPVTAKLERYVIKSAKSLSTVSKDVKIEVEYHDTVGQPVKRTLVARVICERAPFAPSKDTTKGTWGVNPISLLTRRRG